MTTNMGTPNNPEGVEHFGLKVQLFSHLREKLKIQESVWLLFREHCEKCRDGGGITLTNVLENVRSVAIEEDYPPGNFRPDITLWGAATDFPLALIEVENTAPISQRKQEYCLKNDIPVFVFDAGRDQSVTPSRVLYPDKAVTRRCWYRQRRRDEYLLHQLYQLPDGLDVGDKTKCRFGIEQSVDDDEAIRLVKGELYTKLRKKAEEAASSFVLNMPPVKRAQRYVVGEYDVSRVELQRIVVRHLLSLDWGKRSLSTKMVYDTLLEVMHEIHMENNIPVEEWEPVASNASDAKALRGTLFNNVLVYPKRLGFQGLAVASLS